MMYLQKLRCYLEIYISLIQKEKQIKKGIDIAVE